MSQLPYLRSAAARSAVKSFQARTPLPRRAAETEKTVLARHFGHPNDEDLALTVANRIEKSLKDRWALLHRNIVLTEKDSIIYRNDVGEEKGKAAVVGSTFKGFPNVDADALIDIRKACEDSLKQVKTAYFFDDRAIGVSQFARTNIDFVTDDASIAEFLSKLLPKAPKSTWAIAKKWLNSTLLLHSSSKDEQSPSDSYIAYDPTVIVARGIPPTKIHLVEALVFQSALNLIKRDILVVKGNILKDKSNGSVTLVLGDLDITKLGNNEIHGGNYVAWGIDGVSRLFDSIVTGTGKTETFTDISKSAASTLKQPNRIIFKSTTGSGKMNSIALDKAKTLFTDKFLAGPKNLGTPLFETLVRSYKVELLSEE